LFVRFDVRRLRREPRFKRSSSVTDAHAVLFSTSSEESLRDFGSPLPGAQQVPRRVKELDRGDRLILVSVLTERNGGCDHSRAEVGPRRVEPEKDKGLGELLVPDPVRRADSTRMRRMASAAAAKKCGRFSNSNALSPTSRSQASWTSAVGCKVCPGRSLAILCAASLRSSS